MTPQQALIRACSHIADTEKQLPGTMRKQYRATVAWWLAHHAGARWSSISERPNVDPCVAWWMQHLTGALLPLIREVGQDTYLDVVRQIRAWMQHAPATPPENLRYNEEPQP